MPKHVHAELIKLWADGAEIQHLVSYSNVDKWVDCVDFDWLPHVKYRLKPKSKTIKYKRYFGFVYGNFYIGIVNQEGQYDPTKIHRMIDTEWQEIEVPE